MADRTSPARLVRHGASAALVTGIVLGCVDLFRALSPGADRLPLILQGIIIMIALVAMAAALYGIASIIDQHPRDGADASLRDAMDQVRAAIEQLPANLSSLSALNGQDHPMHPVIPAAQMPPEMTEALLKMTSLLEEIREASMMDEPQRQARQKSLREHRKLVTIADAASAIQSRQWGRADKLIAQLEIDFPGDPAVVDLHRKLSQGRGSAESESVQKIKDRVEDLMAISSWDEAYKIAVQFADNYPDNSQGAELLVRVTRERDLFNESTVHQLYEEIKADLERRRWRRALAGAQRLLDRFPEHRKTAKIRAQLKTVQENAEIEERQEQELRIQEMVRSKRFSEAIELAEDLLDRFPLSPQAESLEEMLPKMRDLAFQKDIADEVRK